MNHELEWPHPESPAFLPKGRYKAWIVATDLPKPDHSPGVSSCAWRIQGVDLAQISQPAAKRSREDYSDEQRAAACALIGAIESVEVGSEVTLRCASAYVVNAINGDARRWQKNNWRSKKGRVKNIDVWTHYLMIVDRRSLDVIGEQWPKTLDPDIKDELMALARSARSA